MERTVNFCLRVLFFSLIALPVLAQESVPLFVSEIPSLSDSGNASGSFAPTMIAERPFPLPEMPIRTASSIPVPELDGFQPVPDIPAVPCSGTYWIVSSRNSVQNVHEAGRGPWGVQVYQRLPDGQFIGSDLASLSSQLNPTTPICIFAHGSFVKWESMCAESHAFYQRLTSCYSGPLQMIFFTWPSDGPRTHVLPVDVAVRGRRADFNGFHLSYLISQLPPSSPVTLIGHSHGTRVILSTMHLAGGGSIEDCYFPYSMGENRRYRAVLAAGAMDHNWLNPGQNYSCALNRLECLLNLQNREDAALAFYPFSRPFAGRAIARSGFTRHDHNVLGPNAAKVRDVDVTNLVGPAHYWPDYYRQPTIVATVLPYLSY